MDNSLILYHFGLEPAQALIYQTLLEEGEMHVKHIQEKTHLSRAGVYDALMYMEGKLLVEYRKSGRHAFYKAAHPTMLFTLAEEQKRTQEIRTKELEKTIRQMTGVFALANNKPGVRFFEGKEGVKEVWWDSLRSKEEICTIGDLGFILKHYDDINDAYVAERAKKNIAKRAITNDTAINKNYLTNASADAKTSTRFIKDFSFSSVVLHVYENTVGITTVKGNHDIGILIEDPLIAAMHKQMFNALWHSASPFLPPASHEPR